MGILGIGLFMRAGSMAQGLRSPATLPKPIKPRALDAARPEEHHANSIESGTDHEILADHASRYLGKTFDLLSERERSIVRRLIERRSITHDTNHSFDEKLTTAEQMADRVAEFGGSWTFIVIFAFVLLVWVTGNIATSLWAFDPYPFIFLSLILSMLAAAQAPSS